MIAIPWLQLSSTVTAAPVVPEGFGVRPLVSGLPPFGPGALQGIAAGAGGGFGHDLFYIRYPNEIWRVSPAGGSPQLFSILSGASDARVMSFGFGGDLFVTEGGLFDAGKVYRVRPDGTHSVFVTGFPGASEGIAYSPGGSYDNRLFISEFDIRPNPVIGIDAAGNHALLTQFEVSDRLTGLAFAPGGSWGTDLFGVDHDGRLFDVAPDGTSTLAMVLPFFRNETLAFGRADTRFGDDLFVSPDRTNAIFRISREGAVSVFASQFDGFLYEGVSGLTFGEDGHILFVTDDRAGAIYAIAQVPEAPMPALIGIALAAALLARRRRASLTVC
jgi:sugar lactone lactonase YvrE